MAYETKTNYCCDNLKKYNDSRKRKVACIENGKVIKVFDSLVSVADDGFNFGLVGKVARGERPHHKGYKFKYID